MEIAQKLVNNEKKKRIAVVGDIILDEYYQVQTNRISPEGPIPVFHMDEWKCEKRLGGAANVVTNAKYFSSIEVVLFGVMSSSICEILEQRKIKYYCEQKEIPVKKRFYVGNQCVFRCDVEKPIINHNIDILKNLSDFDAVILSDYNKGLFTKEFVKEIFKICYNIPLVVDPKKNYELFKGCTTIKPNWNESLLIGNGDIMKIKEKLKCKNVVITRSELGPIGCENNNKFEILVEKNKKCVVSQVGAGDQFLISMVAAQVFGYSVEESAKFAHLMGMNYCSKGMNEPVHPFEAYSNKIITINQLPKTEKLIFTNGVFDVITRKHVELLKFAKKQGDKLIVALNDDLSVRRLKGSTRPINKLSDRMSVLEGLECVDYIISFSEDTPYNLMKEIGNIYKIVKGSDYTKERVVGNDLFEVTLFPYEQGYSSSRTIELSQVR